MFLITQYLAISLRQHLKKPSHITLKKLEMTKEVTLDLVKDSKDKRDQLIVNLAWWSKHLWPKLVNFNLRKKSS